MYERSVGGACLREDMSANEVIEHLLKESETREKETTNIGEVGSLSEAPPPPLLDYSSKRDAEGTLIQDEMTTETAHLQD